MADQRITDLTQIYNYELADGDLFEVVDVSDTSGPNAGAGGENKRITRAELVAGLATRSTWNGAALYTMTANERYVGLTGTLTGSRSVRLPLASSVPPGAIITFADEVGGITSGFNVNFRPSLGSSDTIEGYFDATGSPTPTAAQVQYVRLKVPYASASVMSDGTSKWSIVNIKPAVDVQTFTANGTWQRPVGFTQARIILFGGGGGGGSGRRGTTGVTGGGGGGGAGGVTVVDVPLSDLPDATYTVTVGASAAGGAARTTTTNGAAGTTGNVTWLSASTLWTAQGGANGTGGGTIATDGVGGNGGAGTIAGARGGDESDAGAQGTSPTSIITPGAGGGGGTNTNGSTAGAGGAGGNTSGGVGTNSAGLTGGTAGTTAPSAGGAGTAPTTISAGTIAGGSGGGGGGAPASGAASAGGDGAAPGGGGGGGGGSNNANSGAGGAGARGAAIIICW